VYTPLQSIRFEAKVFGRIKNFDTAGFILVSRIAGDERDGWSFGVKK